MTENEVVEKKRKERFEAIADLRVGKNIAMKIEPGSKPKVPSKIFRLFYDLSCAYNKEQLKIDSLSKKQKERKKDIIDIAKANDGVRGIISEKDKFNLTVSPSKHVVWDRDKLVESLGGRYYPLVFETYTINIALSSLAIRKKTKKTIDKALKKALISLGIPEKEISKTLSTEININVDEQYLNELVQSKEIKLLPGTRKSEIIWKVRIDPLRSK